LHTDATLAQIIYRNTGRCSGDCFLLNSLLYALQFQCDPICNLSLVRHQGMLHPTKLVNQISFIAKKNISLLMRNFFVAGKRGGTKIPSGHNRLLLLRE